MNIFFLIINPLIRNIIYHFFEVIISIMITIAVQAGGKSSRMGQNKALMPFLGTPLIERVISRLSDIATEILIISNDPEPYLYLGKRVITDRFPGKGPLMGLYSALLEAQHSLVVSVACDMPFVNPDLFKCLVQISLDTNADVVVPTSPKGLEPLHAVYKKLTCLPVIRNAIQQNNFRIISWFPKVNVKVLTCEEIGLMDPGFNSFFNINTAEDLRLAEEIAESTNAEFGSKSDHH